MITTDEYRQVGPRRPVVGTEQAGDAAQRPQVGDTDQTTEHTGGDDGDHETTTRQGDDPEEHE